MRTFTSSLLAVAALAAGCGGGSPAASAPAPTHLLITLYPGFVANPTVKRFTLTCNPAGGTLPHAARACAALDHAPLLLLHPAGCGVGVPDVGTEKITGVVAGRPVRLEFGGGCARWRVVGGALGLVTSNHG